MAIITLRGPVMQLRTCGVGRRFRLSTAVDMQGSFLARRRAKRVSLGCRGPALALPAHYLLHHEYLYLRYASAIRTARSEIEMQSQPLRVTGQRLFGTFVLFAKFHFLFLFTEFIEVSALFLVIISGIER